MFCEKYIFVKSGSFNGTKSNQEFARNRSGGRNFGTTLDFVQPGETKKLNKYFFKERSKFVSC